MYVLTPEVFIFLVLDAIASLDCLTPTHGQIIRTGIQVNIFYLKNLKGPINKTSLVDLAQTKLWLLVVLEC